MNLDVSCDPQATLTDTGRWLSAVKQIREPHRQVIELGASLIQQHQARDTRVRRVHSVELAQERAGVSGGSGDDGR